jgi:hypothetical protein
MAITVTAKKNGKPVEPVKTGRKQTAPGVEEPKKEAQKQPEDTIVPRGNHPQEAVYVARDKKSGAEVSFDQWGRKLDSLGHVVAGDRQRAGDAGAKEIYRPPVEQKGPPPQPNPGYTIGAGITPAPTQRSSWDNSVLPGTGSGATRSSYDVPERGALNNNWLFGAGKLKGAGGWEDGGTPLDRQWRSPSQQAAGPMQAAPQMGPTMPTQAQDNSWMPQLDALSGLIPMQIGGLSMPQIPPPGNNFGEYVPEGGIYDPQGPRRDSTYLPEEDTYPRYVPQGGMYDPQGRRRR